MIERARYSIGIDLGTTNCALAYVDLSDAEGESLVLGIRQLETASTEVERSVLPSFLYLGDDGDWVAGLHARERGREVPESVIHSAKSWLCHHSVSPQAAILPWQSKGVADDLKCSPIAASARLLEVLKDAWELRFGAEAPFAQQTITVTVPASFDAAAQAATLEAARLAGYPVGIRLLEEPQAAFYRWLESAGESVNALQKGERILVVDIGGGTSDFSLFEVGALQEGVPRIERISVSEHLLLGGDNIDLALAHALESELTPVGEELSVDQWGHLISRARELKEACLSEDGDRLIPVSLPSKGAGLFAGTLSTEVSSQQARALILDGFFPECSIGARAERAAGGLLEMGLPYAVDCAVTRHLAEYLGDGVAVDRILFNGGSLSARVIRDRLLSQFALWRGGRRPAVLVNAETDLAVARGAAHYGASLRRGKGRIDAGAARAVFLEVAASGGGESQRVCVLPKGAQPGERFTVESAGLRLVVNQKARFQAFQGSDAMADLAGQMRSPSSGALRALPPMEAMIELVGMEKAVPVRLVACVNEVGLMTVACEALESEAVWPLEFNLRGDTGSSGSGTVVLPQDLGVSQTQRARAGRTVKGLLLGRGSKMKASQIFKEMESVTGQRKHEWDLQFCRELLADVIESDAALERSAAAAEAWLQLGGYLMRPGFGAVGDEERLRRLSQCLQKNETLPPQVEVQRLILLRRIVSGFSEQEQEALFERELETLQGSKRSEAERIRLLGALELLDLGRKERLLELFFERLEMGVSEETHVAPLLAGFAGLLSRPLFRAGADRVVAPDRVELLFETLKKFDWKDGRFADAIPLFLRASRVVDDRSLNVSSRLGRKIVSKLEKSGVAASRLLPLRDYVPVSMADRDASFGEALPPGLLLG